MIDEKKLIEKIWNIFSETYNNAFNFDEDESKLVERVMIDVQNAIEEQPKIGGWIPCSERLPEEEGVYLVTKPNFGNWVVDTMYFCRGSFTDKYVIAWQPLPEEYHG
nr:DUF551 domain-containing protein [uncultured Schaedlerella sp.]